jgi:rhamnogalacturonyl hydrolase YesR
MSWNHARSPGLLVRVLRSQEKVSCGLADWVISVNEGMRENLQTKGVLDHKIFIVHNFPDEKFFPLCDPPTSWPRSRDSLVLLYCGTVTEQYDLGLAVKAMARLVGEIPVKLRILGRGNRLTEVLNLASTLGVRDSVEYIGLVPVNRLRDEMRKVDAGISCHRAGVFGDLQFSTKIVEYLTQGLPALSPRTRTMTRYLPENCVFYFEPGSDAALADTLRFIWHNPAEVLRRVAKAREKLPSLSWQVEKGRFLSFYSDLISDRNPTARRWLPNEGLDENNRPLLCSDNSHIHRREQVTTRLRRAALRLLPIGKQGGGPRISDLSLQESIAKVERWVETHHYKGYEPFDGLSSYLRPLAFGNQFLEQIMLQVVRQSPINLRPLFGIKPLDSTKGRGYMAWGYLTMLKLTGTHEYRQKAINCLEWLIRNKSPLYPNSSWGNHFDFASRSGKYSKHEPIIVWTSLIGQVFLDGYEILSEQRYLDVAKDICQWILRLPREKTPTGTCLSYLALRQGSVHNANMLGGAMLARTAKHTENAELFDVARAAMEYSCCRQLPDGAWYYAEDPRHHWIDNFHTGYNLDSLKCYIESTDDRTFKPQLDLGFHYFKENFLEPSGRPKYYHNRAYPIDIQCASQAIETLSHFSDYDPDALSLASRVARWTIEHMQDSSGYFYYRRYPLLAARIPMLHWGQATTYRALALLLLKLSTREGVRNLVPQLGARGHGWCM